MEYEKTSYTEELAKLIYWGWIWSLIIFAGIWLFNKISFLILIGTASAKAHHINLAQMFGVGVPIFIKALWDSYKKK